MHAEQSLSSHFTLLHYNKEKTARWKVRAISIYREKNIINKDSEVEYRE